VINDHIKLLFASIICLVTLFACSNSDDGTSKSESNRMDNDNRYANYPTRYSATALPFYGSLLRINNKAQVTGLLLENNIPSTGLWSDTDGLQIVDSGKATTDSAPACTINGGYMSVPISINDSGMILGRHDHYCNGILDYYIWEASVGSVIVKDKYPGVLEYIYGLDNQGNLLGKCYQSLSANGSIYPTKACIVNWYSGQVTNIPDLSTNESIFINSVISRSGVVATNCLLRSSLCTWDATQGLQSVDLKLDSSTFIFNFDAVNDRGEIIGEFFTQDTQSPFVFYATIENGYSYLPRIVYDNSYINPQTISNSGVIVGFENPRDSLAFIAVIWKDQIGYDLNRLVDDSSLGLEMAVDISDQGKILASDSNDNTYLLTPHSVP